MKTSRTLAWRVPLGLLCALAMAGGCDELATGADAGPVADAAPGSDAGPAPDGGPANDAGVDGGEIPIDGPITCPGCPPPNPFTPECRTMVDAMDGVAMTYAGTWSAGLTGPGETSLEPGTTIDLVYGFQGGTMLHPLYFSLDAGETIPSCVEVIVDVRIERTGDDPVLSTLPHYPSTVTGTTGSYIDGLRHELPFVVEDIPGSPLEVEVRLRTERGEQTWVFPGLVLGSVADGTRI
jgi:hypothetical protein